MDEALYFCTAWMVSCAFNVSIFFPFFTVFVALVYLIQGKVTP